MPAPATTARVNARLLASAAELDDPQLLARAGGHGPGSGRVIASPLPTSNSALGTPH